ncbi:O-antigen ligase family protein [Marinobacter salinisoli]|uniref:O-antigen ligase family protein n=1 Tax=Marinobacter salinisoli TaxID=2769486 RepID=A0ABX7MTR4_9GAMM|nr:O-antigen ligase family protein [Marinobacter salinisoli]QSP94496.1 O-antigen ligase family protein [Marinobacter salinisoli]
MLNGPVQSLRGSVLFLFVIFLFVSILFADLLPLPLNGYEFQRFLLVIILALTVPVSVFFFLRLHGWAFFLREWEWIGVAVGFLVLALPSQGSSYVWVEPGMYAAFFFGIFFLGMLPIKTEEKLNGAALVAYASILVSTFYGATSLLIYVFAISGGVSDLADYIPWGFANIRYWSHLATWLLPLFPLAVLVGPWRSKRRWQFFVLVGAALWWWIVFLSMARGTLLGLAFGLIVVMFMMGRSAIPWLKVVFRHCTCGFFAWLLLCVLVPNVLLEDSSIRSINTTASGRLVLFGEAWTMSLQNFPWGMGSQAWLTHEIYTDGYRQAPKFAHPHSMYLMWAAEYGWLLVVAVVLLVVRCIRSAWRRCSELGAYRSPVLNASVAGFLASVSAAMIHAGASAVFLAPGSMLTGFVVLSIFWGLISEPKSSPSAERRIGSSVVIAVGVVACLSIAWFVEVGRYYQAMKADIPYYEDNVREGLMPRFWLHGNFPRKESEMP